MAKANPQIAKITAVASTGTVTGQSGLLSRLKPKMRKMPMRVAPRYRAPVKSVSFFGGGEVFLVQSSKNLSHKSHKTGTVHSRAFPNILCPNAFSHRKTAKDRRLILHRKIVKEARVEAFYLATINTVRLVLSSSDQAGSTSDSGTGLAAILKPPGTVAFNNSAMPAMRCSGETLPRPLPISSIADDRRTALGSVRFGPLAAPTWINRMGLAAVPAALEAAIRRHSALFPHR